jgi:hypothetical protein
MLFVVGSQDLAGSGVDEMHLPAGRASYGFEGSSFVIGWIVGDPSLNVQACNGAPVDESDSHGPTKG